MMPEDSLTTILAALGSTAQGLSSGEARSRLKRHGFNGPVSQRRTSWVLRFLSFFANRLALILPLAIVAIVLIGVWLPLSPLDHLPGFVPLPPGYFVFLVGATLLYLVLIEIVKGRIMARLLT
jgi:magnesium-transporting ATPase (P-type)